MTLDVRAKDGAALVRVRAQPGARRDAIVGIHGDALKVAVAAPPDKGRANQRIAAVLADRLGIAASHVAVVAGHASRDKRVRVEGFDAEELRARLLALVAPSGS